MPAGNLWERLRQFQQLVGEIQQRAPNPRDRQVMGELLEQIKTSQAQAEQDLPRLLDHLRQQAQGLKAEAEAAQQKVAQAIQKAEALHEEAGKREQLLKKPPVKPAATIDPHLGKQLQAELLGKLGKRARQEAGAVDEREAWQDWQGFESRRGGASQAEPPAPPAATMSPERPEPLPAPPPAAALPQAGSDDADAWSGLSRADQSAAPPRKAPDTKRPGEKPAEPASDAAAPAPAASSPAAPAPADMPAAGTPHQPEPKPRPKHKPKKAADDNDDDIWKGLSKLDE